MKALKTNKLIKDIIFIFLIILYISIGVCILLYNKKDVEHKYWFLSWFFIASGLPQILFPLTKEKALKSFKAIFFFLGIAVLVFGIIALVTQLPPRSICLGWAIFDLIRRSLEIFVGITLLKENKLEIAEIAMSALHFVLAFILLFESASGLYLHLLVLAIAFFLSALKRIIELIITNIPKKA